MVNLTRWNPRNELELNDPFRSLDQMMDEMWRTWPTRWFGREGNTSTMLRPAMDVIENDSNVTVRVDLPGLKPEDVQVQVENNILTISGEMGDTVEKDNDRYHYRERTFGSFQRSLRLPNTLDTEKIDATFENGVLNITFAKQPQAQPKQIQIKANNK